MSACEIARDCARDCARDGRGGVALAVKEDGGDAAASSAAIDGERVHVPGVVSERLVRVRVRVGLGS